MTNLSSHLPRVLAVAVLGGAGCTDDALFTDELVFSEYDAKTDSVLTHTLNMTITETHELRPGAWGTDDFEKWTAKVSVTGHTESSVSMSGAELVFEPPADAYEPGGGGWQAILRRGDSGPLRFGTQLAMMVWSRAAGSDDEWAPVEFPANIAIPGRARFMTNFAHFASGEARAYVTNPPTKSCAIVFDQSDHPGDHFDYNISAPLPVDQPYEYRLWVVPIYNFCEWSQRSYELEVDLARTDAAWGR